MAAAARSGSRAEPRCAVVSRRSALCSAAPLPSLPIPRPSPSLPPPTFNPFPPPRGWRLRRALARPRPLRFPTPSVAETDRGREKAGGRGGEGGGWPCGAEHRPRAAPGTRLCTHAGTYTPSCAEPSQPGASPRLPPPLLLARTISVAVSHPAGFAAAAAVFLPPPRHPFPSCSGWAAPELPRLGGGGQSPLPGRLPAGRRMRSGREGEGLGLCEHPHRAPSPLINFTLLIINFTPVKLAQEERGGGEGRLMSVGGGGGAVCQAPRSAPAQQLSAPLARAAPLAESPERRRFPFRWLMRPPLPTPPFPPPHPHTRSPSLFSAPSSSLPARPPCRHIHTRAHCIVAMMDRA